LKCFPMKNKVVSMKTAIQKHVHDGDKIYIGGLVHGEPYFAVHEIIRQRKKDLTISSGGVTVWGDTLVGAGCVKRMITSYMWNPVPISGHAFKRAIEKGIPNPLEVEEYSLLALGLAYFAGSMGLPFVGTRTLLGSDILKHKSFLGENKWKVVNSPFDGKKVLLIAPIRHDVGIVQVQRCDPEGNAQSWGLQGINTYGMNACEKLIICAEEVVQNEVIRMDPNRTVVPALKVTAVVEVPWGAYPSYIQGYYDRDWEFFPRYATQTATVEGFQRYLDEWVYGVKNEEEYLNKIGNEKREALKGKHKRSGEISYGFYDKFILNPE